MDKEEIDGKPFTWVGVLVYSHNKDENVFVGALRFKGENLVLARKVASFVEIYGRRIPVSEIPKLTVTFGNLMVNGKPAKVAAAEAIYPKKVPDYAEAIAKDGLGKPTEECGVGVDRLLSPVKDHISNTSPTSYRVATCSGSRSPRILRCVARASFGVLFS
jgi:hypothetical protein